MSKAVLDASALMALLRGEPGMEQVREVIKEAAISALNLSEVIAKGLSYGGTLAELSGLLSELPFRTMPFEFEDAYLAASLWPVTQTKGLSLGDRCCLALGKRLRLPVLTTDRAWSGLDEDVQVEIILIR
jgi:PIN domain nuclease of toxin-antitoxin system